MSVTALLDLMSDVETIFENICMKELEPHDMNYAIRRCPKAIVELLKKYPEKVFVAGGYIRSVITNTEINDIDLFSPSKELAKQYADELADETEVIETGNAFTLPDKFKHSVQFIHRWSYDKPHDLLQSFDFTIASAAIWSDGRQFKSMRHPSYYADLAAKRLEYMRPERNEDAGGSLLRVLKFYQQGFRIPLDSLGYVLARLVTAIDTNKVLAAIDAMGTNENNTPPSDYEKELQMGKVITAMLHEVDPPMNPCYLRHTIAEEEGISF